MSNKKEITLAIYYKKTGKFKIINNANYSNLEMIEKIGLYIPLGTYSYYCSRLRNKLISKWEDDRFIIKLIDNKYSKKKLILTKEFFIDNEELQVEGNSYKENIRYLIKECINVFGIEDRINDLHKYGIINSKSKDIFIDLINSFK